MSAHFYECFALSSGLATKAISQAKNEKKTIAFNSKQTATHFKPIRISKSLQIIQAKKKKKVYQHKYTIFPGLSALIRFLKLERTSP